VQHLPAEAKEVFDVSGAGDTVVALVSAGLAVGLTLHHAAVLANTAAGIVVGKVGTAVVRPDELKSSLNNNVKVDLESKILDLETAVERVHAWSRQGLNVGFTNGCFDLLHAGHLSLLQRARALCDRLVVAINSDQSVKRLKGGDRPVQTELTRARLLASLIHVDAVLIFREDTPIDVISALRPNILIKGSDYADKQVVGADIVEQAGGRVCLLDLLDGYSTTGIVNQLKTGTSL
jgi:D-beta-D-heptose 7-phosphate kinase/D-beta-D-heptose 1-phosphate adenosyltransferase